MKRLIIGKNCIREVLKAAPERIESLLLAKDDPEFSKAGIPVKILRKDQLSDLAGTESHQGVGAYVKDRPRPDLKSFLKKERDASLVLMLDSIFDPQNFGAILRAAECFGADAVVWSKNRGVDITPVVTKASVGASELIDLIKVSNLAEAVKQFQKHGYGAVTAEIGDEAENLFEFQFPPLTLLIMGSEGKGVQPLISKRADHKVYIPMAGQIDSLNVSQATSVFLSHWKS
jgi:23S rRNA (guanosine2251-2'-O)-methyltransferase